MKGIVAEIHGKDMVVIDEKGNFKVIKCHKNCEVGQEIVINDIAVVRHGSFVKQMAAVAAMFVILVGTGLFTYYSPYSYISVDINPSVEIILNRFERVLDVKALNEDGATLIKNPEKLTHKPVADVVTGIIDEAYDQKYLVKETDNEILITVSAPEEKEMKDIGVVLQKYTTAELQQKNIIANVSVKQAPIEKHNQAKKESVSTGKLVLLEQLQEVSPDVNLQDVKDKSVKEIMKTIRENETKGRNKAKDKNKEQAAEGEKGKGNQNEKGNDEIKASKGNYNRQIDENKKNKEYQGSKPENPKTNDNGKKDNHLQDSGKGNGTTKYRRNRNAEDQKDLSEKEKKEKEEKEKGSPKAEKGAGEKKGYEKKENKMELSEEEKNTPDDGEGQGKGLKKDKGEKKSEKAKGDPKDYDNSGKEHGNGKKEMNR